MQVELFIVEQDGSVVTQINNLLGVNEDVTIHHLGDGEIRYFLTERIRVKGFEDQPNKIFELLERNDVQVMFHGQMIFHRPNWGRDLVEEFCIQATQPMVMAASERDPLQDNLDGFTGDDYED